MMSGVAVLYVMATVCRWARIFWARVRCQWYLLTFGMWRGECECLGWDDDDYLVIIAAARGSWWKGTLEYTRIFFDERTRPETPPVPVPWAVEPPPMTA